MVLLIHAVDTTYVLQNYDKIVIKDNPIYATHSKLKCLTVLRHLKKNTKHNVHVFGLFSALKETYPHKTWLVNAHRDIFILRSGFISKWEHSVKKGI